MRYRKFGRLDWEASLLGFGCMRLPVIGGDSSRIDEPEATRMLRYAIDRGVNYVDTAYPYHGGQSEVFLGRALGDGYRDKIRLATKLPSWKVERADDFDRFLDEQLTRLRIDRVDFYLLHDLNAKRWPHLRDLGILKRAEKAVADGRIGHLGFSFHDKCQLFREIVDAYDWTICQIQYNYLDPGYQAGEEGLRYAAAKGLAVVIMEPLHGGRLADPPTTVKELWGLSVKKRTPADWALQWLWHQPEVGVVLSGMSTLTQVEENLRSAEAAGVGILTAEDLDLIGRVRAKYEELCPIPCTACEYCLPCPSGVRIPRLFELYNEAKMFNRTEASRRSYRSLKDGTAADACAQCRACEAKCPQGIPISEWLPQVHRALGAPAKRQE